MLILFCLGLYKGHESDNDLTMWRKSAVSETKIFKSRSS